jgi:hypothetical protein
MIRGVMPEPRGEHRRGILPCGGCESLTHRMRVGCVCLTLLVALVLVSGGTAASRSPRPPRAVQAPIRHVLPNGGRGSIKEFRSSEVVAVQLWVRVGGRDEAASELGLAHYLEHMLFKETSTRAQRFVDRDVASMGGRMNAGTSLDYTFCHAVLPVQRAVTTTPRSVPREAPVETHTPRFSASEHDRRDAADPVASRSGQGARSGRRQGGLRGAGGGAGERVAGSTGPRAEARRAQDRPREGSQLGPPQARRTVLTRARRRASVDNHFP